MEKWSIIDEFSDYSISSWGHVRNDVTGRTLAITRNQQDIRLVGLTRNGIHYKRSVTKLVAEAFLPRLSEPFDTPINLDGNRANNRVENLMWRPRWFAYKYHQQFKYPRQHWNVRLMDVESEEVTEGSEATAIRYGLIESQLIVATVNCTFVWPTYQTFVPLRDRY